MQNVYTVGQINSYIRRMFAEDFLLQELNIKGEVSNCKYHSSGHIYFTLKDMKGTISCVMFAGNRSGLSFRMTEGMQVVVQGTVDVYERDGKYQVYAKRITLDGEGALFERFQRLKEELLERGMFAPEYKKPIPKYIRTLGVVIRINRCGCPGHHQYHPQEEPLCADPSVSGYRAGRGSS